MSKVSWDADDKNNEFILWLVNEVEKEYGAQSLTIASPLIESAKVKLNQLVAGVRGETLPNNTKSGMRLEESHE